MSIITDEQRKSIFDISMNEAQRLFGIVTSELDNIQSGQENGIPIAISVSLKLSEWLLANVLSNSKDIAHRDCILGSAITSALVTEQRILKERKEQEDSAECLN
jgi:hypothetical protein